jgi:glycosyltransferase 2 family protein
VTKRGWQLVLTIGLSAAFVFIVVWSVNLRQTMDALRGANYAYIPLAVLCSLFTNVLRSYRWKYVLNPLRRIGVRRLFSGVAVGYMANNILPARLGEIVRSYYLGKKEGLSKSSTLATVVIERLFDGLTLLGFLALISTFLTFPDWVTTAGVVAAALFFVLAAVLAASVARRDLTLTLVRRLTSSLPTRIAQRLHDLIGSFLTGLLILRHWRDAVLAFVFSVLGWIVEAATYYVVGLCFDFHLTITAAMVTVAIVNFGILLPAAPGYVGTFEFFCVSALSLVFVERSEALSYALVLHGVLVIPITVIGMVCFFKDQMSLAEIKV